MEVASHSPQEIGEPGQRQPRRKASVHSPASLLAHDTRNWLTVLQVYCDLLQTSGAVDARYQDWINELAAAVGRGQGLVASLLDSVQNCEPDTAQNTPRNVAASISASGEPAGKPAGNTTDLASSVGRRLAMLQNLAGDKIQVSLEIETETAQAALPEGDFDRILQNLALNAIEAMPQGGELRITLSTLYVERSGAEGQSSNMVLLRVSDTGMGISPSLLPSIFQPGVSGKKLAGKSSAERGLGLAVVRDLTVQASGSVRVRSHGGQGACFEIELPAAHAPSGQRPVSAAQLSRRQRAAQPRKQQPGDSPRDANQFQVGRGVTLVKPGSETQCGSLPTTLTVRKKA